MQRESYTGKVETVDDAGQPVTLDQFTRETAFTPVATGVTEWIPGGPRYECDGESCSKDGDWLVTESGRRFKMPPR